MGRVEIVTLRVGARAKEGMGGGGGGEKRGEEKREKKKEKTRRGVSLLSPLPLPAPFDSRHFLLSSVSTWRFHEELTFARPKKTPALQASGT